jgi:hypothetical protein
MFTPERELAFSYKTRVLVKAFCKGKFHVISHQLEAVLKPLTII